MKSFICMLLGLLLLVAQSSSRPNDEAAPENEPPTADNVEIHNVMVIDGVMHEDHPVIMYKEDFVNEDYDPNKQNETQSEKHGHRYKHLRRHHRKPTHDKELKIVESEKTYFDILPETPVDIDIVDDNSEHNSNLKVTELIKPSKEEWLVKHPKKYRSRRRRNAYYIEGRPQTHYYYYYSANPASQPNNYIVPAVAAIPASRYPVAGKRPNLQGPQFVDFANRDTFSQDGASGTPASNAGGLWHNSNPEDADFSLYEERPTSSTGSANARPPPEFLATERPATARPSFTAAESASASASAPARAPPVPVYSTPNGSSSSDGLLRYPEDLSYRVGSTCHRAARICCSLGYLSTLYDCFIRLGCARSIAEISSVCS